MITLSSRISCWWVNNIFTALLLLTSSAFMSSQRSIRKRKLSKIECLRVLLTINFSPSALDVPICSFEICCVFKVLTFSSCFDTSGEKRRGFTFTAIKNRLIIIEQFGKKKTHSNLLVYFLDKNLPLLN